MSININTFDLSERDFPANQTTVANEMATTKQISNTENSESKGCLDDILDMDERIKSDNTEEDDPNFPEQDYNEDELPEEWKEGYVDEILLIEMQEQDEINAMIKGYPTRFSS